MKPRELFRHLPIQRKLQFITVAICSAVLVLAFGALSIAQIASFKAHFKADTATLAGVVANNSTAAVAFDDRAAAAEIVASFKATPAVLYASLCNSRGEVLASYGNPAVAGASDFAAPGELQIRQGKLFFVQPVLLEGKSIGLLYLCMDYQRVFRHILNIHGLVTLAVLAASIYTALWLSRWLSRIITRPLLGLAETARQVGECKDYSVRSEASAFGDELGRLAGAFNQMLERIQQQDAALSLSQQKLESLVNSLNGIVWEWDSRTCRFSFVSQQSGTLLGYAPERWLERPDFLNEITHAEDRCKAAVDRADAIARRQRYCLEYRMVAEGERTVWVRESGTVISQPGETAILRGIFQDITVEKLAEEELEKLNRRLIETSRQAGMAEVATGVLHNVGNVLNSVNVSATLLQEKIARSQLTNLDRVAKLLQAHADDLPAYLTADTKGRLVPGFLVQVADSLQKQRTVWQDELKSLRRNLEHIKGIVAMQQGFARVSGLTELVELRELVEDALQINAGGLERFGIEVCREFEDLPPVVLDKHKVMQILINLISNAKYAMAQNAPGCRKLTLRITAGQEHLRISVQDNGMGIAKENLTRIFSLGFTTRPDGHGFGLHSGALAARELGGSLTASSDGAGTGATFTLELPQPRAEPEYQINAS